MNFWRLTHPARLFAAAILVAALGSVPAVGQRPTGKPRPPDATKPDKAGIITPTQKHTFDHAVSEVVRKPSRVHKPLEPIDPRTKKRLPDNHQVTLPGGKKMAAKAYFAELNRLEKKLNEMGHSLQDRAERIILARNKINTADLGRRARDIAARHFAFNARTMKPVHKRGELAKRFKDSVKNDAGRVSGIRKGGTGKVSKRDGSTEPAGTTKQFNLELGQRNIAAVAVNARLETRGSSQEASVLGEASVDGFLAGKQLNLLKATGSVSVPQTGDGQARVTVTLAGRTVYNKELTLKENLTQSDELSRSFDHSLSFRLGMGPLSLNVKLGSQGVAGVRYFVGVRPLAAEAQFIPFARAQAYAQASVDLVVASGGARGKLQLIDCEMRIGGKLEVKSDPSKGLTLEEHAYVSSNLEMLKGEITVHAEINILFFKKSFDYTFWQSDGIKKNGFLVNVDRTVALPR
jgi:hypothetical protein